MITNSFDEAHFSVIAENIKRIKEEIAEATIKSYRSVDDVRLMAVTKTVCTEYINYAIENCGIDLIGENKVQEFLSKKDLLKLENVEKHRRCLAKGKRGASYNARIPKRLLP